MPCPSRLQRHALVVASVIAFLTAVAAAPIVVHAQASANPPPARPTDTSSQSVVVTGNPLRSADVAAPSSVLSGDALVLRRGSTLGETLDGLPGVSSSYFGPNANRPVIRGQDGDRIRLLSNSGVSLDASSLSYDHAVPIDPLVIERIEVLRGPAALLYGGSAVGGVVNAIDNRIPRSAIDGPGGTAELRLGGPATERGASALVETGGNGLAVHADGFWRKTSDMKVPTYERPTDGAGFELQDTIINSASETYGGAVGGSMVWDHGYLGASLDTFRSDYGTVAEEDVTIDMVLNKLTVAGELRSLTGPISTVRGQWLMSNYEHQEIEGSGEIATTFKNKGSDLRIEMQHQPLSLGAGKLAGVFGLQTENADFSALGEEAFVPSTTTRQYAAFVLEEWSIGDVMLSFGGRLGRSQVDSGGDAPGQSQFGAPQSRSFTPGSAAIGGVLNLTPEWQFSGNVACTERSPTFYELYANGLHVATGAVEVGNPETQLERGSNVDVAIQWKDGPHRIKVGGFYNNFSNYIALLFANAFEPTPDGPVPVYNFVGVPAKLYGMELEGNWRALDSGGQQLDLDAKFDVMRATNDATGQPLPRMPPSKVNAGINWSMGPWAARAEVVYAAAQNRVPDDDLATPAYTLVNLSASYRLKLQGTESFIFAKLNNVGNELAYNATSIATVRPLAPLPGRGLMVGLRMAF
jgi:iron complex outermembrane receptor protein